jgi:NADH dehydrogenase (ubiquinone) 1 beta subcomplex subunit 3
MTHPYHDPWARLHAWRYHPIFSRQAQLRGAFPGLGIATVAFAGYCVAEKFLWNEDHSHHDHHSAAGHAEPASTEAHESKKHA